MRQHKRLFGFWRQGSGTTRRLAAIGVALSSLVAATATAATEGGHAGHGAPHVNWWTWDAHAPPVGWFLFDFVLFVGLIVYYTRGPIRAAFKARHERIKKAITDAESLHKAAAGRYEEYRNKLANVEAEAALHVERGRADGRLEQDQILAAAREYAERLKKDAEGVIASEVEKARARLQHQAIEDLLLRTETMLKAELTAKDRDRLFDEAIATIERSEHPVGRKSRSPGKVSSAEEAP